MIIDLNKKLYNLQDNLRAVATATSNEIDAVGRFHARGKKAPKHVMNALEAEVIYLESSTQLVGEAYGVVNK